MEVETATVLVAGISVVIGVINSIISSRRAEFQRQSAVYSQFVDTWNNLDLMQTLADLYAMEFKDFAEYEQKYGSRSDSNIPAFRLGSVLNALGILVKLRVLDFQFIDETLQLVIKLYWEKLEPILQVRRQQMNAPGYLNGVEYLYDLIQQRERQTSSLS